ncbi:MAG TPA: flagellar filament capping protein FliD [Polyangiaceae bacterium]
MAGTISFGGVGSGIDTEGIVSGLVSASSGSLNALKTRANVTKAAVSTLSDVSSLLANLKKSVEGLASPQEVKSFKATSSHASVVASANGLASTGNYSIEVESLAKEQRTYSNSFASGTTALGQAGSFSLKVGSADPVNITVAAGDTLDNIVSKINSAGVRASASLFHDGTSYRLQLRGLDTGAANALTVTEGAGVSLGLSTPANTFQQAADARIKVDGFTVTRPTNQIQGAIAGVTLALTDTTTAPVKLSIDSDPAALKTKMQGVVDAYNAVLKKVRTVSGHGSLKAENPALAGDSMLRGLTNRLSETVLKKISGGGTYETLGQLGLSVTRDGTLNLDSTKLDKALTADPTSVTNVLAGAGNGAGAMDGLRDLITSFTTTGTGLLATRTDALQGKAKLLQERAEREQDRLNRYADMLRKQFTNMDSTVAGYNAQFNYVSKLFG